MNTETLPRFVVMNASACMPGSCWGIYGKVAVVEIEAGVTELPKMISPRARGVKRIVSLEDRLHSGGRYSALGLAHARARDLCDDLNGAWGPKAQAQAMKLYRIN